MTSTKKIAICDGPGHPSQAGEVYLHKILLFGAKNLLTEQQVGTIHWLKTLGCHSSMKKNQVKLELKLTPERYQMVIEILQKDGIHFNEA